MSEHRRIALRRTVGDVLRPWPVPGDAGSDQSPRASFTRNTSVSHSGSGVCRSTVAQSVS